MHFTIYFNQKPLILSDRKNDVIEKQLQQPNMLFMDGLNEATVKAVISEIQQENIRGGVLVHQSLESLLNAFKTGMHVIVAGGGLVHTDTDDVLLIFRKGTWDLPKGKVDEGERIDAAAVREVQEETGLTSIQLEEPLTTTYHTYYQKGELILKESHWYLMKSDAQQPLTPQTDEDIEQCVWVKQKDLEEYYKNMYPAIIDVLQSGMQKIKAR